jgi:hypothetical protein
MDRPRKYAFASSVLHYQIMCWAPELLVLLAVKPPDAHANPRRPNVDTNSGEKSFQFAYILPLKVRRTCRTVHRYKRG